MISDIYDLHWALDIFYIFINHSDYLYFFVNASSPQSNYQYTMLPNLLQQFYRLIYISALNCQERFQVDISLLKRLLTLPQ